MNRVLLVVLAGTSALLIGVATLLVLYAHDFHPYGGPDEAIGKIVLDAIWIATGLVAWQRRPGNRVGLLMVAAGLADLSGQLYWDAWLPYLVFTALESVQIPIFIHLFLAFPSGRVETRLERRFVAFVYGAWLVLLPLWQLFHDSRVEPDICPRCPANPLLVVDPDVARALQTPLDVLVLGILAFTVVLLVRKVRRASPATRRAVKPVLVTITVAAASLIPLGVGDAVGRDLEPVFGPITGIAFAAVPVAFLVGLLRTRLQRSGVADLAVELRSLSRPDDVRDALARALDDPSLELAFWLPADERYVDPRGSPLDVAAREGRAVTVLEHDGRHVAALVHDPALEDEPELLDAVGAVASLALENAGLQAELRAQLAEVRASRARIVEAGDAERRRLERDIHDGAQQRLLGIRLALRLARGRYADGGAGVDELLAEADAEVGDALEELRALARGIHPAVLDEGLAPAVAALARRSPIPVELVVPRERYPESVEATAYFVASEALTNVAKHAHASRATVAISRMNGSVEVEVSDDGVGGADARGNGLRGLRDRVEALDGSLDVDTGSGAGTRVRAVIPCA